MKNILSFSGFELNEQTFPVKREPYAKFSSKFSFDQPSDVVMMLLSSLQAQFDAKYTKDHREFLGMLETAGLELPDPKLNDSLKLMKDVKLQSLGKLAIDLEKKLGAWSNSPSSEIVEDWVIGFRMAAEKSGLIKERDTLPNTSNPIIVLSKVIRALNDPKQIKKIIVKSK